MESETIVYGGINWRRYPESKRRSDRVYYKPGSTFIGRGFERYLHRQIWRDTNGPIPKGQHIHHADGDTLNNDISNLRCMKRGDHVRHHFATATDEQREKARINMERMRPLAAQWHGSEEGRKWHSAMGAASWIGREPTEHICEVCGKHYETIASHGRARFCSNACKSEYRRRSGVDNVERICKGCGGVFTANKYQGKRFCSRSCNPGRPKSK